MGPNPELNTLSIVPADRPAIALDTVLHSVGTMACKIAPTNTTNHVQMRRDCPQPESGRWSVFSEGLAMPHFENVWLQCRLAENTWGIAISEVLFGRKLLL